MNDFFIYFLAMAEMFITLLKLIELLLENMLIITWAFTSKTWPEMQCQSFLCRWIRRNVIWIKWQIIFRKFSKCMRHPNPRFNMMWNLYVIMINDLPCVLVILALLDVLAGQLPQVLQAYPWSRKAYILVNNSCRLSYMLPLPSTIWWGLIWIGLYL